MSDDIPIPVPKDYGFTIGQQTQESHGSLEVGFDTGTNQYWYRLESAALRRYLNLVRVCNEEVWLHFTESGIFTKTVDVGHVAMMEVSFRGTDTTDEVIGVVGVEVKDLLNCIDKDEEHITLVPQHGFSELLVVNDDCVTTLKAFTSEPIVPQTPELDLSTSFAINSIQLDKACKKLKSVGDFYTIRTTNDYGVKMVCKSGSITREYNLSDSYTGVATRCEYNGCYLLGLCKAIPTTKKSAIDLLIEWQDDKPLIVTGKDDLVRWCYFLAPCGVEA